MPFLNKSTALIFDGLPFLFIVRVPIDKVVRLETIEVLEFPSHYAIQ